MLPCPAGHATLLLSMLGLDSSNSSFPPGSPAISVPNKIFRVREHFRGGPVSKRMEARNLGQPAVPPPPFYQQYGDSQRPVEYCWDSFRFRASSSGFKFPARLTHRRVNGAAFFKCQTCLCCDKVGGH